MMIRYIFWLIFFGILFIGCGTRKSVISKFKEAVEIEQEAKVLESSEIATKETAEQKNDVREENETVTTVKEYAVNPDGSTYLAKETTTKQKGNKTDNSTSNSTKQSEAKQERQSENNIKAKSELSAKDKVVESDKTVATNAGGWGVVVFGVAVAAVLVLVYFFIKK